MKSVLLALTLLLHTANTWATGCSPLYDHIESTVVSVLSPSEAQVGPPVIMRFVNPRQDRAFLDVVATVLNVPGKSGNVHRTYSDGQSIPLDLTPRQIMDAIQAGNIKVELINDLYRDVGGCEWDDVYEKNIRATVTLPDRVLVFTTNYFAG